MGCLTGSLPHTTVPARLAAPDGLVVEHEVLVGGLPDALAHRAQVQVGVEHLVVAEQLHALLRQRAGVVVARLGCNSIDILGSSPNPSLIMFGVLRHV